MSKKQLEIHFSDLTKEAQNRVCYVLNTIPSDDDWELDQRPLFILEKGDSND